MRKNVEGTIKILTIPEGEAPLDVRDKWVGLILPVMAVADVNFRGVLTRSMFGERTVYLVPYEEGLKILAKRSPDAARWWRNNAVQQLDPCFGFNTHEAKVVGTLKENSERIRQFAGLEDVGVGAHDHFANQLD